MHHGKTGGKRKTHKACKKTRKFYEIILKQRELEIPKFESMTKIRSSEILSDENQKKFREKMKLGKLSTESEKP